MSDAPEAARAAPRSNAAALRDWVRAIDATQRRRATPDTTLASVVHAAAATCGDRPALIGIDGHLSYGALSARTNQIARWALDEGLRPGSVIGLLMTNQPEFVAIWLGLSQVGCVVALLNHNLAPDALAHCIRIAGATRVIVGGALLDVAARSNRLVPTDVQWWVHGEAAAGFADFAGSVAEYHGTALSAAEQRAPASRDSALLIFTSGTTGLPKAALVTHARVMEWSDWFAGMMDAQSNDRLYDCLPMYHSVGGVVAVGAMLVAGGAVVIRDRFSARRFWDDITDQRCTIVQYIGELCRYLLQSPSHPREASHGLRLCCGNGLRGDVWEAFQKRFAVPRILEFYAATEGSVSLYNCEGKPGAIGRVPGVLAHRFPVTLLRCDPLTGEPLRDAQGRGLRCEIGEAGEAIGQIGGPNAPPDRAARDQFDGYTDPDASARKILHDVFTPGDRWFRTGDLMRRDAAGYFYFVDRLGDTFRWKGENVSTADVAATINRCDGVIDAVVFGVAIPGVEGKAGMAALAVDARFNLPALRDHVRAHLPLYARPLFVRLCQTIAVTGTFKLKKSDLADQGYAISESDPVWFDDRAADAYIPCDVKILDKLADRSLRL
jgi:fatty-acyl-CoA synthase